MTGSTTLRPPLNQPGIQVAIKSDPDGTVIIADGKGLGETPLQVSLPADVYSVHLSKDGQWYADLSITVQPGQATEFTVTGRAAYPVTLVGLPADTQSVLQFESKTAKVAFQAGQPVSLPSEDWTLKIEGSEIFAGLMIPVSVSGSPVKLDLTPFRRSGSLRIIGLDPRARLWVDSTPFLNPSSDSIQLPLGVHTVYVWENGLLPLDATRITVHDDNASFVTWDRVRGHDANSALNLWTGAGLGAAGSDLVGLGLYGALNEVAISHTSSYQEYVSFKSGATVAAAAGAALLAGAAVLEAIRIIENGRYDQQHRYMESLEKQP